MSYRAGLAIASENLHYIKGEFPVIDKSDGVRERKKTGEISCHRT